MSLKKDINELIETTKVIRERNAEKEMKKNPKRIRMIQGECDDLNEEMEEWNFQGIVMTDWWMQYTSSPEFSNIKDNAYRVRSGVDVLMPGGKRTGPKKSDGTLLKTYGKTDGITLGEMQETAKHVINLVMKLK